MSLKYIISIVLFLLSAKTYLRIIYCLNLILNTLETPYTPCVVETDLARMNTVPKNISFRFSSNSEAFASENLEDIFNFNCYDQNDA